MNTITERLHALSARKSELVRSLEYPSDWHEHLAALARNAERHEEIARLDAEIMDILTHREETSNETV